ncbi:MAG: hypothetical protein CMK32_14610 [Porticoccaceae bacterium]|nr:hypothetical protein [Porticoccaceae bacterium]
MIKHLETKLRYARQITWVSYFLFIVTLFAGNFTDPEPLRLRLMMIIILPLLLFLPGMARENYKSLAMLCFVTLMYFTALVVDVGSPGASLWDWLALALVCILFVAGMLFSRWTQYAQAGNPPKN